MQQYAYPYYKNHKREHDLFIAKVAEVEEKLKSGQLILSLEMTMFLKDWLKKHIQGTDMKYSDFFVEKGLR
jgi:hemerythrin-like metal-binding protein